MVVFTASHVLGRCHVIILFLTTKTSKSFNLLASHIIIQLSVKYHWKYMSSQNDTNVLCIFEYTLKYYCTRAKYVLIWINLGYNYYNLQAFLIHHHHPFVISRRFLERFISQVVSYGKFIYTSIQQFNIVTNIYCITFLSMHYWKLSGCCHYQWLDNTNIRHWFGFALSW